MALNSLLLAFYVWNYYCRYSVFKVQLPVPVETRY